ncbi:hypothetical protein Bbelb_415080 [Branchiostoma belcheri]|nr:hypothetical protein Bbelb_415080 [Branchiostoma belcheri]
MAAGGLLATVPTPGFFHLDLFIKDTKDVPQRHDELKAKLDLEKGPMESAMTSLLSVFAFHKVRGQCDALALLEDLTKKDENNLNAIANKQFIYGQLLRTTDETACRDRLQELLQDKSYAATARNARCYAEQGYALSLVRDDSKDMASKIKQAISLFNTALSLMCDVGTDVVSEEERLVWKYYLGQTYWRLNDIRVHAQTKATLSLEEREEGLLEAQRLFIDVTKLDQSSKQGGFYIARAWGLLGALEYRCREKYERYTTPDYLISQIPQTEGPGLEWGCYKKALEINPTDYETYRRFGQSYSRQHLNENARQMFDKSIDIMPEKTTNWFAYFNRSLVNLNEYDLQARRWRRRVGLDNLTRLSPPDKQLLKRAKQDAIASCEGATTPFNTYFLGKICHRLAIHPVANEVEDKDELENALGHFDQALQLEDGYTDCKIHSAKAWSLEVAGEHEKAAESYKRAVENDEPTFHRNIQGLLTSLLTLHGSTHRHREYYTAELAFWINEGYRKYEDTKQFIRYCVARFGNQMIEVCRYLIDNGNVRVARMCLECFKQREGIDNYIAAASMMSAIPEDEENGASKTLDKSSARQPVQENRVNIPVRQGKSRNIQGFQYDFFVLHGRTDASWVNHVLVPALEVDWSFKACVVDRDFVPGESAFKNIIYSIENSYKTLLILTPNFVTSEWCKYETEQALVESLKSKTGRVIPIMLQECDVPASLRTITYLDVSRDAIGPRDWLKLKKSLEDATPTE